jgi:hypothetical protein
MSRVGQIQTPTIYGNAGSEMASGATAWANQFQDSECLSFVRPERRCQIVGV